MTSKQPKLYLVRPREDREDQLSEAGYVGYNEMQLAIVRATSGAEAREAALVHACDPLPIDEERASVWRDPELVECIELADLLNGETPAVLADGWGTG